MSARRPRPDAWFSPTFVLPAWWRGPAVVTVHDLIYELMPERYRGRVNAIYATRAARWSARRATRVLCGSRETRDHMVERWGIERERVAVTPYGVSEVFRRAPGRDLAAREDFLLVVGVLEARKGLDTLAAALSGLEPGGRRPRLVLAGRPGWGAGRVLEELLALPGVELVRDPDDEQLASLYRRARALVYPSRMEGFGLPVAEALASGCPVIASDLASVREFAGDAALYAPPGDASGLRHELERLLADPGRQAALSRAGPGAVAGLTWSAVAARTAAEIERAVSEHRPQDPAGAKRP